MKKSLHTRYVKFLSSSVNPSDELNRMPCESEIKLKVVQEIAKLGYWEWNLKTQRLYWSDELSAIFGVEPGSIKFMDDMIQYVHSEDTPLTKSVIRNMQKTGKPISINFRVVTLQGEITNLHLVSKKALVDQNGNPTLIMGIGQDITDQKKIDTMGGEIRFESKNGEGTTFTVVLPQ